MNPLESFSEFSTKVGPTDLMLYAGVALVLFVLFKDKFVLVPELLKKTLSKFGSIKSPNIIPDTSVVTQTDDIFFDLVSSWKQTRDLAVKSGCSKAVEVADQMFPHLSPTVCKEPDNVAIK